MIEGSDSYCQKRTVALPFEQAIARTREALCTPPPVDYDSDAIRLSGRRVWKETLAFAP